MIKCKSMAYNKGYDCYVIINDDNQPDIVYKGEILKKYVKRSNTGRSYYIVNIPKHGENYVHIITMFAYHSSDYYNYIKANGKKPVVNHIDNNPLNNALDNLEYTSQSDNIIKANNYKLKEVNDVSI